MLSRSFLLSFAFVLMISNQAIASDPTFELHRYLISMDFDDTVLDVNKVKKFISDGANPHTRGPTGGNALNVAVESFAYITSSDQEERVQVARDIVQVFLDLNVDPGNVDGRGISPVYALIRYGANNEPTQELIDTLLSKKPYLEGQSRNGYYAGMGLIHLVSIGKPIIFKLLDMGLSLTTVAPGSGQHFAYRAAAKAPGAEEVLLLKRLLDRLDKNTAKKFADKPVNDNSRPIHQAARNNNLAAIRYLVETYGVDVNAQTQEKETPLSLATDLEVKEYLKSVGAILPTLNTTLDCDKVYDGAINYESVVKIIKTCKLKSIESLLARLPNKYKGNYALAYATLAVQGASPEFPQVITFGRDGKLMMAFNGHQSQTGFRNLEILQFRDKTKIFEARDIEFPKSRFGEVIFSEVNPDRCVTCHGNPIRPLWDTWTFWPGKFHGEMEAQTTRERSLYDRFLKNRDKGRYKYLPSVSQESVETVFGKANFLFNQNSKMDHFTGILQAEMAAEDLRKTDKLTPCSGPSPAMKTSQNSCRRKSIPSSI